MVTTPNYDLDIDTTLGGNNASDYVIPSQKAIKAYVDNSTGGNVMWGNIAGNISNQTDLQDALDDKQDALVSGSNIKTINSTSILGSGNISVATSAQGALADTALQPNDNISELTNNAGYITSSALAPYALSADLATVATSGSYNDLSNKPTIPAAQVNSDWNATSGVAQILNKPTLATVATSGSYDDLSNKPTIPDISNLANKDLSNLSSTGNAKFQEPLVSGTNIKTINNNSILGSGNLTLDGLPSQTGKAGKFLQTDGTDASWESAPFRNIGEIVASTIPLTDAGLHLLDGSLIQGNGIYQGFVDYIADLYGETAVIGYKSNVTKIGSLSDNNGVLSGFSTSNYATLSNTFNSNSNTWEFVTKINLQAYGGNVLSGKTNPIISFWIDSSGYLNFNIGNGSSWVSGDVPGRTPLQLNTDYYIKLLFNGSEYISSYSVDGETWQQEAVYSGNISINNATLNLGISRNLNAAITGSIDLKESYINISGQRWWTGAEEIKPCFCTEAQWQTSVTTYGVCGKFVYDATANTVRLPKVTGIIEGTTDASALGNLVEAGLPNITGIWSGIGGGSYSASGAVTSAPSSSQGWGNSSGDNYFRFSLDASRSNPIYGNSSTVQPQTIKALYYIVIATSTKTDIQVDIDEIATDLNGKADTDLSNVPASKGILTESYVNGKSWYRVYSDGWCEQGGFTALNGAISSTNKRVTFLKAYKATPRVFCSQNANTGTAIATVGWENATSFSIGTLAGASSTGSTNWCACGYIN